MESYVSILYIGLHEKNYMVTKHLSFIRKQISTVPTATIFIAYVYRFIYIYIYIYIYIQGRRQVYKTGGAHFDKKKTGAKRPKNFVLVPPHICDSAPQNLGYLLLFALVFT